MAICRIKCIDITKEAVKILSVFYSNNNKVLLDTDRVFTIW